MNRRTEAINNVVIGYTGSIYSVGSCEIDERNLANLEMLMELVDCQLAGIIDEYISTKRSYEYSRQKSNLVCREFLSNLDVRIREALDE